MFTVYAQVVCSNVATNVELVLVKIAHYNEHYSANSA